MQKKFFNHYNKNHDPKYFFHSKTEVRSTAYGSGVAQSFSDWLDYFYANWNGDGNFLLSKQASVDGNAVRGNGTYRNVQLLTVAPCRTSSFLPPLYLRDKLFEVSEGGVLKVNGVQQADLGRELKAWALLMLKEKETESATLAVIAKPQPVGSKTCLALYAVEGEKVQPEPYATYPLGATLRSFGNIICFGRHIFICHDGQLQYLYLSPFGQIEEVPIGSMTHNAGKACCAHVGDDIVTDGKRVFWIADNTVYGIKIGEPHRLVSFNTDKGVTLSGLSCFDGALYVKFIFGGHPCCYRYTNDGGGFNRIVFGEGAEDYVFLNNDYSRLRYLRIAGGAIEEVVRVKEDAVGLRIPTKCNKLFCLDSSVAENVRYVGYGKLGELVSFKIE